MAHSLSPDPTEPPAGTPAPPTVRPASVPAAAASAASSSSSSPSAAWRRVAAALHYRDFRVLWLGAFISTVGTWMQKVAQNWLVLTLTGSAFYLGLDSFLGEVPILLFTLVGGVIADRHDRRRLLMGSQYVQMACAFTLAALLYWDVGWGVDPPPAAFDRLHVWHILTLSFIAGCAQAFGGPAYQSLIPSLVDRKDLPNAIALNSIQFNLARIIGPLVAALALAGGLAVCFSLNGLSFLVVIVALMSLHVRHVAPATRQRIVDEMRIGVSYVRHEPSLVALTGLAFLITFLALPLHTFLPIFAQRIFGQEVAGYSRMLIFSGAGAVTGALVVAWRGRFAHMGRTLLLVLAGFGLLLVAFALCRVLWVSHLLLFCLGASLIVVFALLMSLVQLIAPDDMRGRVMSCYMVAFRGGSPLGSLASGYAASLTSAPTVLAVNGVLLALVALVFLIKRTDVRRL